MVSTNLASGHDPQTYREMREKSETLLKIAKEIETIARTKSEFYDDADFLKLKGEFNTTLVDAMHLGQC